MDEKARFHVISASGGLYFHGRALINAKRWRPFADSVARWLEQWPCPKKNLILIGPSAGYTLPTAWLRQFDDIIAFDLDPIAGFMFRRRHGVRAQFHRVNLFLRDGRLSLAPLSEVMRAHPHAGVLFCNVLGQLLLEIPAAESEWRGFLRQLRVQLSDRNWASYHDLTSAYQRGSVTEVTDHLTDGDWLEGLSTVKLQWALSARRTHLVQAVSASV